MLPAAEEDCRDILRYFERRFDSPQAIRSFHNKLLETLANLTITPRMYAFSTDSIYTSVGITNS